MILLTLALFYLAIQPGSSGPLPSFPTGGDMLDYLIQSGDISERDGLLATWYHRANGKEEMNKALASKLSHTCTHRQNSSSLSLELY